MTARAVCAACARRLGGHVAPGCPVCHGAGAVDLGPRVDQEEPAIVARAVELYLAACTWDAADWDTAGPTGRGVALDLAAESLRVTGFLAPSPTQPSVAGYTTGPDDAGELRARDLARDLTGPGVIPATGAALDELAARRRGRP